MGNKLDQLFDAYERGSVTRRGSWRPWCPLWRLAAQRFRPNRYPRKPVALT